MAAVVFFDQWAVDVMAGQHDHTGDDFRIGVIDAVVTPIEGAVNPRWGAGGGVNYSANEVAPGGSYAAGGMPITNPSVNLVATVAVFDGDDVLLPETVGNPPDARWGIIYNNSNANKRCVGFIDFGGVVDLSGDDFAINWGLAGIASLAKKA